MGIKAEVDVVAGVVVPATNFPVSEMTVFFFFCYFAINKLKIIQRKREDRAKI